ncbi:MAG TPA: mechanosensitive ion channel [bacterium]|nr:mechanosensitive ion channel [bacterium]HPQ65237.1 mechanosensitive ion channel [bacterium]
MLSPKPRRDDGRKKTVFGSGLYIAVLFLACALASGPARGAAAGDPAAPPAPAAAATETGAEARSADGFEDARNQAQAAREEVAFRKKEVELERREAEIKRQEADLARRAAETAASAAAGEEAVKAATLKAQEKEQEAVLAQQETAVAEERMSAAQGRARQAETALEAARARAARSESESRQRQRELYRKLLQTLLILAGGYVLIYFLIKLINHRVADIRTRHLARKHIIYSLNLLIIVSIVFLWFHHIGSLTIFLSAVAAGIALALQEVILSVAGWFVILIRRPFEVGDRVEFGGVKGDIIDIQILQTSMLEIGNWVAADQSTGRIVHVPNSAVFKKENYNYSRGFEYIWNELAVLITFESDWRRAEEIMLGHAGKQAEGMEEIVTRKIKKMSRRYMIHYGKLSPIVYVAIKDSGVELTLRYLTDARKRRITQDFFSRAILDDFRREEGIELAYPTYRIVK